MLVYHLNAYTSGGAATAARRLHRELSCLGIQGRVYHSDRVETAGAVELDGDCGLPTDLMPISWDASWRRRVAFRFHRQAFKAALKNRPPGLEFFTSPRGTADSKWPPKLGGQTNSAAAQGLSSEPDIFHLHWISRFIDYESFFGSLPLGKPIVWTLHDMNAFTGGCHFSSGCERFRSGCGHCPQLGKRGENDFSRQGFKVKQKAVQGLNLHVVAPSRWMVELAASSPMLKSAKSFSHIPLGVSPERFKPMDKQHARAMLGLDPNAFIISLGAMSIENRRKGTIEALRAVAQLSDLSQLQIVVFGSGTLPEFSQPLPRIHAMGAIRDQTQRIAAYSASDLFMLSSLEDNLPLTGLEALACGTPIIGFAVGGIPDYVRHNQTGRLVTVGDSNALALQARELIANPQMVEALGRSAREMILEEYSGEREAKAYAELYATLCNVA